MRSRRQVHAAAPDTVLVCVLVLASGLMATTAASPSDGVLVGRTALGALLGITVFGAGQRWSRDGRSRRP